MIAYDDAVGDGHLSEANGVIEMKIVKGIKLKEVPFLPLHVCSVMSWSSICARWRSEFRMRTVTRFELHGSGCVLVYGNAVTGNGKREDFDAQGDGPLRCRAMW